MAIKWLFKTLNNIILQFEKQPEVLRRRYIKKQQVDAVRPAEVRL